MSFCHPLPTIVTGTTYPAFQAALAALVTTYDGHWTACGPLTYQNGCYRQAFQQQFPIHNTQNLAYEQKRSYFCGMLRYNRGWRGCC